MEKHEFYRKYSQIPLSERPILLGKGDKCFSPDELYRKIKVNDILIREAENRTKELLEIADKILK